MTSRWRAEAFLKPVLLSRGTECITAMQTKPIQDNPIQDNPISERGNQGLLYLFYKIACVFTLE